MVRLPNKAVGLGCALLALLAVECASAGTPQYVATREVLLRFSAVNAVPVEGVDLWLSRDGGRTWLAIPAERVGPAALRCTVPEDGWYGFYLVLHNAAGASAMPPEAGDAPHAAVIVDTVAPALQVHANGSAVTCVAGEPLHLRLSLIEEHLADAGPRVFCRSAAANAWKDAGRAALADGELAWLVPADLAGSVELRFVATDLAGNQAVDELDAVLVTAQDTDSEPEPSPVAAEQTAAAPVGDEAAQPAPVPPARPEDLQQLRHLADRFLGERRYAQAAARLEEALELSPDDADVLVDLGSALYWSGRYEEAGVRFGAALAGEPDHTGALEGLALVAATQKRYPEASAHLEQLLRLLPESSEAWLHYGDVEHKLGHRSRALEAWQRVLKIDEVDEPVRAQAEKRLKYFGTAAQPQP